MQKTVNKQKSGAPKATTKPRTVNNVRKAPVATSTIISTKQPKISTSAEITTVQNREFYTTLSPGNSAFTISNDAINPGNARMFPWLANISPNYEMYRFRQLKFEYRSRAPTTTAGGVYMVVDYDVTDIIPTTKQTLMVMRGGVDFAPWVSTNLVLDQKAVTGLNGNWRYTRTSPYGTTDPRTSDVGNFIIATDGCASLCGDIFVDYIVELKTPQPFVPFGGTVTAQNCTPNNVLDVASSTTVGRMPFTITGVNQGQRLTFSNIGKYLLSLTNNATSGGNIISFAQKSGAVNLTISPLAQVGINTTKIVDDFLVDVLTQGASFDIWGVTGATNFISTLLVSQVGKTY